MQVKCNWCKRKTILIARMKGLPLLLVGSMLGLKWKERGNREWWLIHSHIPLLMCILLSPPPPPKKKMTTANFTLLHIRLGRKFCCFVNSTGITPNTSQFFYLQVQFFSVWKLAVDQCMPFLLSSQLFYGMSTLHLFNKQNENKIWLGAFPHDSYWGIRGGNRAPHLWPLFI